MKTLHLLVVSLLIGCGAEEDGGGTVDPVFPPGAPVDGGELLYDGPKRLFVDDAFIESMEGMIRVAGVATKLNDGRPVIEADQPWEHPTRLGFYNSAVYDESDGLFKLWYMAQHSGKTDLDGREAQHSAVGYAHSVDGVSWQKPLVGADVAGVPTNLVALAAHGFTVTLDPNPVVGRAADTANQLLWDPYLETYMLVTREDLNGDVEEMENRGTRVIRRDGDQSLTEAPMQWADAPGPGVTDATVLGYTLRNDPNEGNDHQVHAALVYPYGGVYFAFLGAIQGDILFYEGSNERFGHDYEFARMGIGSATLRLDGLVYLEAADSEASLVTSSFLVEEGDSLEVNIDAREAGAVVEVLDEAGEPVSGFAADDADALDGVDNVHAVPTWSDDGALADLSGMRVKLRFHLRRARLYSFSIAPPP